MHKQALALEEANGSKDLLLSIIGHDLKNPMTGIMGYSDLLATDINQYSTDEIQHFAREINTGHKKPEPPPRQPPIVGPGKSEKDVAKGGKNQPVPGYGTVPSCLFFQCEKQIHQALQPGPCRYNDVNADPEMIRTIIMNLVSNAIKFTPDQWNR